MALLGDSSPGDAGLGSGRLENSADSGTRLAAIVFGPAGVAADPSRPNQ